MVVAGHDELRTPGVGEARADLGDHPLQQHGHRPRVAVADTDVDIGAEGKELERVARPIKDNAEIRQVATISANNNPTVGKLIGDGFTVSFDVTVGFSTARGLYFSGAGGIEFTIPIRERPRPVVPSR